MGDEEEGCEEADEEDVQDVVEGEAGSREDEVENADACAESCTERHKSSQSVEMEAVRVRGVQLLRIVVCVRMSLEDVTTH